MLQFLPSDDQGKTSFASGGTITFDPWVPVRGPTERRNVLLGILFKVTLTQVDVATAVVQGEDLIKLWPNVKIRDMGDVRVNGSGQFLRHMAHLLSGPQRWHESADLAVAAPQTTETEFQWYWPLAKPFERRPEDYGIGADVMGDIVIQTPTQDTLDIGSSAVTLDDLTYKAIAIVREEDTIEQKMRDVVDEESMRNVTQHTLRGEGRYLTEALAYADGASGGAAMTNWTAHRISGGILPEDIQAHEMLQMYRYWRNAGDHGTTPGAELYNDPFLLARARVLWMNRPGAKLVDHPFIEKGVLLRASNSVGDVQIGTRYLEPTHPDIEAHLESLYGIRTWRAKTANKTRRNPSDWGAKYRFINKSGVPGV